MESEFKISRGGEFRADPKTSRKQRDVSVCFDWKDTGGGSEIDPDLLVVLRYESPIV